MAATGFWSVKGKLKDVIEYAQNPDKTTDTKYLDDDLYKALRYVGNVEKTDKAVYVDSIKCTKKLRTAEKIIQRYPELQRLLETERQMEKDALDKERERGHTR